MPYKSERQRKERERQRNRTEKLIYFTTKRRAKDTMPPLPQPAAPIRANKYGYAGTMFIPKGFA